jgi:hypothetical protein
MEVYAGANGKPGCNNGDRVLEATFDMPRGMASNDAGLLVADTNSHKIRLVCGNQVITYAGTGKQGSQDGKKETCSFTRPTCIVKSGTTTFISEPELIRMIDVLGMVTSMSTCRNIVGYPVADAIFSNQSVLMVSPDSRKLYEIDYDDDERFVLVIARLDSGVGGLKRITLGHQRAYYHDTNWPTLVATPQGYIISHHASSQLHSWDSDDELSQISVFKDQFVYQMTISPESGNSRVLGNSLRCRNIV